MTSRLSFGNRLLLCLAAPALLFLSALAVALWGVRATQSIYQDILRGDVRLARSVAELRAQGLRSGQLLRDASISPGDKQARAVFAEAIKSFQAAAANADDVARGGRFDAAVAELTKKAQAHAALQHKVLELLSDNPGEVLLVVMEQEAPAWNRLHADLMKIIAATGESADTARAAADASAARSLTFAAALALAAVLGAGGLGWVLRRMVAREIGADPAEVRTTLGRIAEGDLRAELLVPAEAHGSLLGMVATMNAALQRLVQQVRECSLSIELASAEVAAGNSDMSQRTERAAANLQRTASAMGQLTSNLKESAGAASTANELAQSAAEVARRGGNVVSEVVTTMDEIHASAQRIADITGVIDGIAFQTNILALNAAVEAARAGEQGRGFAVVAAEVRSLAQRSATAAREIKDLIGNSVDRVASGARLVRDAGETMHEIVTSVHRVSEVIGQITLSTGEQSAGLGSINGSVTQLDEMTQQNAALVEQSAAAALSLKQQAERLAAAVALFQLAQEPAAH